MLHPDMIDAVVRPLKEDSEVHCTVLAMDIIDDYEFRLKDTVKIVHNIAGDVLSTSRAPIPWCEVLSPSTGAKRIFGILAFRWKTLRQYTDLPESPLEIVESCDSNRLYDYGIKQRIAPYKYLPSFAVDNPIDIKKVEDVMVTDEIFKKYN